MILCRILFFVIIIQGNLCYSQFAESNIVLINASNLDRLQIAGAVSFISSFNPKVISIDIEFDERGANDKLLIRALWNCKNLVIPTELVSLGDEQVFIGLASLREFSPVHAKTGFVSGKAEFGKFHIHKRFQQSEVNFIGGQIEYHFSVTTAMVFDSLKTTHFIKSNPKIIDIDFKNGARKFKTFSSQQVANKEIIPKDIEGKIVMIGFLGPGDEDKWYTPLNKKTVPHHPDMYGLEILANIVSQILESK
jgi:CHASE2 domain-containing sensor protein